ncbi:FAD-dependent monooxygenase [Methylobacterium sp. E-041]|uniref:FAD-dependent oxidoreductase n=1 Tax=Methylobacterium sp. E-041 TaxID=2836573 RepID=UPI001FB92FC0|nr:FAD-dependent monooxygenase [Methylobacterium sp. E-041]MCJ2105202.1 FAD-dependent monooxygenase [Methylobacterium sp. E-041]
MSVDRVDVAILGAGIAGTAAAAALERQGISVALIARHERHPHEFRAEKMGAAQMRLLDGFGLGAAARAEATAFDGVWVHRFGRIVDRASEREYGIDYARLIDALRRALPPSVRTVTGKAEAIACSADLQTITLADGRVIQARLLVVATGLADGIRQQLGIARDVFSPAHTLAAGFDLETPISAFPFPSLVWTGEQFGDRVSYLTLFPLGDAVRANFYVYRKQSEPWTRAFREAPETVLHGLMPGFEGRFGRIRIAGPVVTRPIDLMRVRGHERRDGVVVVGDAFCTVCPITGTGIDKALTDVDQLCHVHIPAWLATPGTGAAKIARFYADPVKRARDRSAVHASLRARSIKVDTALPWRIRRFKSETIVRALYRSPLGRLLPRH